MTTNHFSNLDPALIRPGRVDVQELLDDAAGEQAKRLFVKFYGSSPAAIAPGPGTRGPDRLLQGEEVSTPEEVEIMGDEVSRVVDEERQRGRTVSMASLQGLFIRNGPRESVAGVRDLCGASTRLKAVDR